MDAIIKFLRDLLVLMLVAFPPFLYLYQYSRDKVKNILLRALIYIMYWVSTIAGSNFVPALTVLFLIWRSKSEYTYFYRSVYSGNNDYDEMTYNERRFKLDCTDYKWDFSLKIFLKVALWGIVIKYGVTFINSVVIEILTRFKIVLQNQEIINEFLKSTPFQSIFYFVIIVFCAPVVEEFVFRFWIYDRILKDRVGPLVSALFSSLLFMTAHFNIQGAIAFFLIGMINCMIFDRVGYWGAVANHFMFNLISAVLLISIKIFNIPV